MNTLQKIEKALDIRFEKDSSLYISKEDTEKIKQYLYQSNYQNIWSMAQKLGYKIVTKVILKNSWMIDMNDKTNLKYLTNIFDMLDNNFIAIHFKEVIDDKIYSTIEFKNFIELFYVKTLSVRELENIYQDTASIKMDYKLAAFKQVLFYYAQTANSSQCLNFFKKEIERYNLTHIVTNNNFLQEFINYLDNKELVNWIIENELFNEKLYQNLLVLDKETSFPIIIDYLKNNRRLPKNLVRKVLPKFYKVDNFENSIVELYKKHYRVGYLFLDMLEPTRFKDNEMANRLVDVFLNLGLNENLDSTKIKTIREKKIEPNFDTPEEIIENIQSNIYLMNKLKTLQYFSYRFQFTNQNILIDLYECYGDDENVRKVLSFFIADLLNKNPKRFPSLFYKRITGNDNKDTNKQQYIDTITNYIEELNLKSKSIQTFLEKFEKHQVLLKLKQR